MPRPAAIILELVQGEGGSIPAPASFVHRVAAVARELDIPLIVDEVQTGCGRTGTWYAFEQYGIEPDVIIASKGLSGLGLPVSVILYPRRLDRWGPGSHIGTFRGNNLAFASGNAYLQVLRQQNRLGNVQARGAQLRTALAGLQRATRLISDVRGLGLILGMEMAAYPAAQVTAGQVAARVQRAALRRGLILETGGRDDRVIRILPPLNVTSRTISDAAAIIAAAVTAVEADLEAGRR